MARGREGGLFMVFFAMRHKVVKAGVQKCIRFQIKPCC